MDSTLTLLGSIVIGGIFLLGLMTFYGGVVDFSYEKTIELLTQETAASIMEIIEHDFQKIGSGVASPALAISNNNIITFSGDVDEDGLADEVQYSLSDPSAAASTPNPNDRILYRDVNGIRTIDTPIGVTAFNVTLLDFTGNPTTELMDVWQISVSLTIESPFAINGQYSRAFWLKRITPINLSRPSINDFD